jgi:hypothetical protein
MVPYVCNPGTGEAKEGGLCQCQASLDYTAQRGREDGYGEGEENSFRKRHSLVELSGFAVSRSLAFPS